MKEFDLKSLSEFDGKDGKPVYIAYKGKVYDVTNSKLWKNGIHMNRHFAGKDLTDELSAAPHSEEVFSKFQQVGVLKVDNSTQEFQNLFKIFWKNILL